MNPRDRFTPPVALAVIGGPPVQMTPDLARIEEQARKELMLEEFRERVRETKQRLRDRAQRPWHVRLFPWRIRIERRD